MREDGRMDAFVALSKTNHLKAVKVLDLKP